MQTQTDSHPVWIVALAPMAGVTDWSFRELCRQVVPDTIDLFYTEMITAKGIKMQNRRTMKMLPDKEEAVIVQLFGCEVNDFMHATTVVIENCPKIVGIDINAACPVKKVLKSGAGASLTKNIPILERILRSVEPIVHQAGKSLSIKIRKGYAQNENFLEILKLAVDCGVDRVAIHGRTVEQGYSGEADFSILQKIPVALSPFVLWSGDIVDRTSLQKIHCDPIAGFLVGRASIGNPWVFREISCRDVNSMSTPVTIEERITAVRLHIQLLATILSENKMSGAFKKFVLGYTKALSLAKPVRNQIMMTTDIHELEQKLISFLESSAGLATVSADDNVAIYSENSEEPPYGE